MTFVMSLSLGIRLNQIPVCVTQRQTEMSNKSSKVREKVSQRNLPHKLPLGNTVGNIVIL